MRYRMMLLPIEDLLDEERCYQILVDALHPDGLRCPHGHRVPPDQPPHDRHRAPLVKYRCHACGRVFNAFTGTPLHGCRYRCSKIVLILRGFCQGVTTRALAKELHADRINLLELRHRVQGLALERFSPLARGRPRGGSRRDVPERRRERHSAPGS